MASAQGRHTNTRKPVANNPQKTCVCFIISITHSIWCGCNLQQPKPLTANFSVRKYENENFPIYYPYLSASSTVSNLQFYTMQNTQMFVVTLIVCLRLTITFQLLSFGWPNVFISRLHQHSSHHNYNFKHKIKRNKSCAYVVHSFIQSSNQII